MVRLESIEEHIVRLLKQDFICLHNGHCTSLKLWIFGIFLLSSGSYTALVVLPCPGSNTALVVSPAQVCNPRISIEEGFSWILALFTFVLDQHSCLFIINYYRFSNISGAFMYIILFLLPLYFIFLVLGLLLICLVLDLFLVCVINCVIDFISYHDACIIVVSNFMALSTILRYFPILELLQKSCLTLTYPSPTWD